MTAAVDDTELPTAPNPAATVAVRPQVSMNDKLAYARELAQSGLVPASYRGKPANVLFAAEYGAMLGLSPVAAMTGIHVIEGKPTASSALMSALVRRAGHRLRVSGNDTRATVQIVRADDPEFTFESEWSIERARQAGLTGKSVWKNYPAAMLKARAISECARDACEEALMGMHYTPEELGANVNEDGQVIQATAEIAVTAPPRDWDAEIAAIANDADALRLMWKHAPTLDVRAKIEPVLAAAVGATAKPAPQPPTPPAPAPKPDPDGAVEAELVEDEPSAEQAASVLRAQAAALFSQFMAFETCEEVQALAKRRTIGSKVADVDVSGLLTADHREILDIPEGVYSLGGVVAKLYNYTDKHGVSPDAVLDPADA